MSKFINEGLTFDDVLVVPGATAEKNICTKTRFSKNINLNIPVVSASMASITESKMAIAISRNGGIGIIHGRLSIEEQATEVDKVKRAENGVITDPFSLSPNNYIYEAEELMARYKISGVPITEHGLLVGILTNRDLRFVTDYKKKIYEVMTRENLITAPEGIDIEGAKKIFRKVKVEKLPIVDDKGYLKGLITIKDIQKAVKYPNSCKDSNGRLLCAASVPIDADDTETLKRVKALHDVKVDAILIEGYLEKSDKIIDIIKTIKAEFNNLDIVVGNVVTPEGVKALCEAGADAIVIGYGSGSTSTARVITGVGVPQITALMNCYDIAKSYNTPIISDGGIKYSGDIIKALVAGADACILGNLLAGTDETPGEIERLGGGKYKLYSGTNDIKEKGVLMDCIVSRIIYKGSVHEVCKQVLKGFKVGMASTGLKNIKELQEKGSFVKVSSASIFENHPSVENVIKESENYSFKR